MGLFSLGIGLHPSPSIEPMAAKGPQSPFQAMLYKLGKNQNSEDERIENEKAEGSRSDSMNLEMILSDEDASEQDLLSLIQAIQSTLKKVLQNEQLVSKEDVNQLVYLLEQWTSRTKGIDEGLLQEKLNHILTQEDKNVFDYLSGFFEKNALFSKQTMYHGLVNISISDVIMGFIHEKEQYPQTDSSAQSETLDPVNVQTVLNEARPKADIPIFDAEQKVLALDVDHTKLMQSRETILNTELLSLINDVQRSMKQVLTERQPISKQVINQLLAVLEQWTNLTKGPDQVLLEDQLNQALTKEERQIFEHLLARFEKRSFLSEQKMYQGHATITKSDVMKWLGHALQSNMNTKIPVQQQPMPSLIDGNPPILTEVVVNNESIINQVNDVQYNTSGIQEQMAQMQATLPMSKIEQYTIHVQQMDKVEQISQQLVDKMTTILKDSGLLVSRSQNMQLAISLNPANLGEMTIRFMQVNGVTMVQMLVTSQTTKELLESNLHQLKSVFAPHQIAIERDERVSDDKFYPDEEHQDEHPNEEQPHDGEQQRHDQTSQEEKLFIDFDTMFQALKEEWMI